jgi:hypothetical protein
MLVLSRGVEAAPFFVEQFDQNFNTSDACGSRSLNETPSRFEVNILHEGSKSLEKA